MKATCPKCHRRVKLHKSREIKCKCGFEFKYADYFKNQQGFYLVDTNTILYAINHHHRFGQFCIDLFNTGMLFATTDTCIGEIVQDIPYRLKVYKFKTLTPQVSDLQAMTLKQPSKVDLSLLQVAIDHPEIKGIITHDGDFKRIASAGIVSKGKTNFFVGNAEDFLRTKVKHYG